MPTILNGKASQIPFLDAAINTIGSFVTFRGSQSYWEARYARGGDSGAGSYGLLAEFKAEFLNEFVRTHGVRSVVEIGCGDGNQLSLAEYPKYVGLDVSDSAVELCRDRFSGDPTKSFELVSSKDTLPISVRGDLALSLDVIYHLVEDVVFDAYMQDLFDSSERYVIVYSSNSEQTPASPHVRHREFTTWVANERPRWKLQQHVPNPYPYDYGNHNETSFSDFFVFAKE